LAQRETIEGDPLTEKIAAHITPKENPLIQMDDLWDNFLGAQSREE
jgi:hypothetical protein